MIDWNSAYELEQRVKEIIVQQEEDGWQFDIEKAKQLLEHIEEEQNSLYNNIRPNLTLNLFVPYNSLPVNRPFLQSGNYSANCIKWMADRVVDVWGVFTRVEFREPNLDSEKQLKKQLFQLGWKPTQWNYKKDKKTGKTLYDEKRQPIRTSPKLTEDSYKSLTIGIGPDIAKYLILSHRKSQITGLINNVREDGTISAQANTIGTPTYRFRHRVVVNIPKAKKSVYLGKEVRGLFIARPGRVLVGHDAAGLEARMESHWTYDINKEYALELIHGDNHQANADKWGVDRDLAKNGKYALLYGAYPPKLAATLHLPKKKTQYIFDTFWSDDNPVYTLKRRLEWYWKNNGFIEGLDGRKIFARKKSDLINYLFQSSGAIVMKRSLVILDEYRKKYNVDAIKVGDQHDEGQNDVLPSHAELFGQLAVSSIRKAGEYYNLNIPLDADYKVGESWAQTH